VNADDVRKALDEGSRILRERGRPAAKKSSQIRLSNALACARRMYLLDSGEAAEELSAETLRIFELGTSRGATLAETIMAGFGEGWTWQAEKVVTMDVQGQTVPGHVDLYGLSVSVVTRVLFEFKTMASYAFDKLDENDPTTISDQYLAQTGCYASALAYPETFFVAESKENSKHKIVHVPRSYLEAGAKDGHANLGAAIRALREKKRPDRPFTLSDWQCSYCGVWKTCWGDEAEQYVDKRGKTKLRRAK
jgi:hypothetical protein